MKRNKFIFDLFTQIEKEASKGKKAAYIPQLERAPDVFNVSFCTCVGEVWDCHKGGETFSIQSIMKPALYGLCLNLIGVEETHKYVGFESSGADFNKLCLDKNNLPHNPLINAGAIMVTSLVLDHYKDKNKASIFEEICTFFTLLCGSPLSFDNSVFLSESEHANQNRCLAYMMKEKSGMKGDVENILQLYFSICSLCVSTKQLAIYAATLANNGINPSTKEKVFEPTVARKIQSQMLVSGLYDASGTFAFEVGLPAKSGVAGGIIVVVPGKLGFATYEPNLSPEGNSVKGVQFIKNIAKQFDYSIFGEQKNLIQMVAAGLHEDVKQALERGEDVNQQDYDGRTPLHVACDKEDKKMTQLLLHHGADETITDRFGNKSKKTT